jgi:amidohydrolase
MRTTEELKRALCAEVDSRNREIIAIGTTIARHPERGFQEFKTAALVAREFAAMGLPYREGLAMTGVKARLVGTRPGPTVALLGELDAVLSPQHPQADPRTGAAHACGHNGQVAAMLGAAMALIGAKAMEHLAGNVVLFAVPAEENVDMEHWRALRAAGKVDFLLGKQELIRLGEFNDVDLSLLVHETPRPEEKRAGAQYSSNGTVHKSIEFRGRAADAAPKPHLGVNALNAATIALHAVHVQRETFRDDDCVRINPILTKGGHSVSWVPAETRIETTIRAKTVEALDDADAKVDRSARAGAVATGAKVQITTLPGISPLVNHRGLMEIYKRNCLPLIGGELEWTEGIHRRGGSDMGDLSLIMPALQSYTGGVRGESHGADHEVFDSELFYLIPAKAMAMTVVDLLCNGAREARALLTGWTPRFTRDQYVDWMRRRFRVEEFQG